MAHIRRTRVRVDSAPGAASWFVLERPLNLNLYLLLILYSDIIYTYIHIIYVYMYIYPFIHLSISLALSVSISCISCTLSANSLAGFDMSLF